MSEVVNETQQEFWRPPSPVVVEEISLPEAVPANAEVCPRCSTEFLLGSRFCHSCGCRRPQAIAPPNSDADVIARHWENLVARVHSSLARFPWRQIRNKVGVPSWLHYLHFHEIQRWVGLPTASLIAFVIGLACVAGALLVGLLTAKTLVDWQAIQFYRAEWLLAATASFVAGILLRKPSDRGGD
jgi:hypothetical protein